MSFLIGWVTHTVVVSLYIYHRLFWPRVLQGVCLCSNTEARGRIFKLTASWLIHTEGSFLFLEITSTFCFLEF